MFHVKKMSIEDFMFAISLTDQMGWNLAVSDFEFMMELEPEGCFVLSEDSERIGIATTVSFGKIGWFGNLIVSKNRRGKGAGSLLVRHSIKYLKSRNVETVGLYAYVERIPFYRRLGFEYDSDFVVLKGKGFSSPIGACLREPEKKNVQKIVDFDRYCFGSSRRKLLEPILLDSDNLCYMHMEQERILGYAIAEVFGKMAELGPLTCMEGRSDIAVGLLRAMLGKLKGFGVSLYVPKNETPILSMLLESGFSESFQVARMSLGAPVGGNCIYLAESLERG